jgi:hypothetical protein
MPLSNYSELTAVIETWLAREGDTNVSSNAADFVALAGARLNRDLPLRVMQTTVPLTGTVSSRAIDLPTDFIEPYALHLTTFGDETMQTPLVAGNFDPRTTSGTPAGWCINGETIELDAPCDQAHTFNFRYRKSFTLSVSSTTTWLLTNHPDCYLSACMVEACLLTEDQRGVFWEQKLQRAMESIAQTDARSIAVATLQVDPGILRPSGFDWTTGRTWP